MAALAVVLGENVKQEWLNVVVEGLVIEKELCKEAQILAVDLTSHTINFKDGEITISVNLVGWRVEPVTLGSVAFQDASTLHVLQAELTEVELWQDGILLWVGGRVPCLDLIFPKLDHGRGSSTRV